MIGPYRLEEKIGSGGMGVVYRAFDERLERRVAIKHIRRREATDRKARERLRREARTVASLNHPAIVQIHDIINAEDGDWIVMEMVEGNTLHHMLQSGPLPLSQALYLALEIVDGLAEAHSKGVVHRDLKTENVMVTPAGHAKILDFGLAKRLWTEDSGKDVSLSVHGTILGTGRAMSPEQVLGEDIDHRSDLFSFGTLLYEMVSGVRPFIGSSLVLTMAQVCSEEHRSLAVVCPDLPPDLVAVVDRLLQKKPEHRPQSARETAAILSQIAGIPLPERGVSSPAAGARSETTTWSGSKAPEPTPTQVVPLPRPLGLPSSLVVDPSRESTTGIFLKTLVKVILEDKERLREKLGAAAVLELFGQHGRLVQSLVEALEGRLIDGVEGLLVIFERPIDAVQFALDHRQRLMELGVENGVTLTARAGIHLGEILVRESHSTEGGRGAGSHGSGSLDLEGPARQVVSRLVALARPGQVLVTREACQLSRHALDGRLTGTTVRWREHGRYHFDGIDDPVKIFEAGAGRPRALLSRVSGVQKLDRSWLEEFGRREVLVAGLLLAFLIATGLRLFLDREETAVVPARSSVAVFQFKNLGQPEEAWLSTAFSEFFVAELEVGQQLRLISGENISRVRVEIGGHDDPLEPEMLRRARRLLGADYLLVGSFLVQGSSDTGKVTLVLRLQDTRQRRTIALLREVGRAGDLSGLVQKMGDELREHMGVQSVVDLKKTAAKGALPHNANALKAYSEGLEAFRGFELQRARAAFERVVAIEPKNAIGHAGLSQAWRALGYDDKARESASRAFELSKGLPRLHALSIEGHHHEAQGEWPEAIDAYRKLWDLYPDNVDNGLLLAAAQVSGSRADEALETLVALRRLPPPGGEDPRLELATAAAKEALADHRGMLVAARAALSRVAVNEAPFLVAEARRLEGFAHYYLGEIELADQSLGDALQLFDRAKNRGKMADILSVMAFLRDTEGELSAAEEYLRQALELQHEVGSSNGISRAQNGLAYMLQAKGELREAGELLREALITAREVGDQGREATYLSSLSWVTIKLGHWSEAEKLTSKLESLASQIGDREELTYSLYYAGRIAAETGDLNLALVHYKKALDLSNEIGVTTLSGFALRGLMEVYFATDQLVEVASLDQEALIVEAGFQRSWEVVSSQVARARMWREQGQAVEAAGLAWEAAKKFRGMERRDEEVLALGEMVLALWDKGDGARAGEVLAELQKVRPEGSENPRVRLMEVFLTGRALVAAGDGEAARRIFEPALAEAREFGLMAWQLEFDLALAEIELTTDALSGQQLLEQLAKRAEERGFQRVARKARALFETSMG
jgi:serine/threonine protein kinase/tetratricopeptide (TPR) repeat protein